MLDRYSLVSEDIIDIIFVIIESKGLESLNKPLALIDKINTEIPKNSEEKDAMVKVLKCDISMEVINYYSSLFDACEEDLDGDKAEVDIEVACAEEFGAIKSKLIDSGLTEEESEYGAEILASVIELKVSDELEEDE